MTTPSTLLTKVRVEGFRSIKEATVHLGPINVLIGPNGAGKSNLLTALRLPPMMRAQGLRLFVGEQGGASRLLHYGPSVTRAMGIALEFKEGDQSKCYEVILKHAAGDSLVFDAENLFLGTLDDKEVQALQLGSGHAESELGRVTPPTMSSLSSVWSLVEGMGFFHFHNTASTAPLRQNSHAAEHKSLRPDGSNLATILYRLKQSEHPDFRAAWKRIEGLVQSVAPSIKSLDPNLVAPETPSSALRLYWQDTRGHRFDASDLSDGTLRAIALITALAQPAAMLPRFIAIDEPELGLHPSALSRIASLARSVSHYTQILLSTQSPALLDEFEPEQVIVVEQHEEGSSFERLNPSVLEGWLAEYSLSELYDKNVLGGRP
jgi:predicted ATPase